MYNFYYDESEHSRKVNYSTISSENFYDSFVTAIVGWKSDKESEISEKYTAFEETYSFRKKNGELKSDTIKPNQFKSGFASFNKQNIELLSDYLDIISNIDFVYLSCTSKIEFIVFQLLRKHDFSIILNWNSIKYSIIKALITYRPQEVIKNIYNSPNKFIESLVNFFTERIELNKKNPKLKWKENEAFEIIVQVLRDAEPIDSVDWDYHMAFEGLSEVINKSGINQYILTLDKEGEKDEVSRTLASAKEMGLENILEDDSKNHFGIRMADMLAGIVAKFMKSLSHSLHNDVHNEAVSKTLLDKEWFQLSEKQLSLYKKLYHVLHDINADGYFNYTGVYCDDFIAFRSLLEYMNHFNNVEEISQDIDMIPEYCNGYMISILSDYFKQRSMDN